MRLRQWIGFLLTILIIWLLASYVIDNSIILPDPMLVGQTMVSQLCSTELYQSLGITLIRVIFSVTLSFLFAFVLSFVMTHYKGIRPYFDQILLFIRSIPNVTFVILLLFWIDREMSIYVVSFLLLFPIFYQNLAESIEDIQMKRHDFLIIYPQSLFTQIKYVYVPELKSAISSGWITCSSLGFKVVVMAEILTSISAGVGYKMQFSRLNIDLAGVMAWTIWLLICVSIFNKLLKKVLKMLFS